MIPFLLFVKLKNKIRKVVAFSGIRGKVFLPVYIYVFKTSLSLWRTKKSQNFVRSRILPQIYMH